LGLIKHIGRTCLSKKIDNYELSGPQQQGPTYCTKKYRGMGLLKKKDLFQHGVAYSDLDNATEILEFKLINNVRRYGRKYLSQTIPIGHVTSIDLGT